VWVLKKCQNRVQIPSNDNAEKKQIKDKAIERDDDQMKDADE